MSRAGKRARAMFSQTALINIASIVEKADENVLPAVYFFIGRSLNASLSDLGTLTLCRAVVQAVASPLSGVLGDRFDRTRIVAAGCALWGVMTAAIGLSHSLWQARLSCALNGVGLALVIPCISSLLADLHPAEARGHAFGLMGLISAIGGMAGGFFATNIAGTRPLGVEGWRFSFHLMALVSLATSALVLRHAVDPRRSMHVGTSSGRAAPVPPPLARPQHRTPPAPHEEGAGAWETGRSILAIRSFQVIVLQGIVGSIPWQAMVMFTLWLQLLGFSNLQASMLMATFSCGCAAGSLAGGALGDAASRRSPSHGRIATAQLSVACGLPLSSLLLKGLPTPATAGAVTTPLVVLYASVLLAMGLTISWCGCNNSAMFAELVPERHRSQVYAFDRSFEGAVAACGAPLVGLAAERWYGFRGSLGANAGFADGAANSAALSSALLLCMLAPWVLCLLSYNLLHLTYPGDKARAAKREVQKERV